MDFAAGQAPEQISVDCAESELAARRLVGRAGYVFQQPGEFGAGKIRIENKPGLGSEFWLVPFGFQLRAQISGAAVLPDDGTMQRTTARPLPQQCGFRLFVDAEGGNGAPRRVGLT